MLLGSGLEVDLGPYQKVYEDLLIVTQLLLRFRLQSEKFSQNKDW